MNIGRPMEDCLAKLRMDVEKGTMDRRRLIQGLGLSAAAAIAGIAVPRAGAAGEGFKAVAWNHISHNVSDVAKSRDFYVDLFGMKPTWDDGIQSELDFGDPSAADSLYIRKVKPGNKVGVDHLAWSVDNWVKDRAEAELKRLGLNPTPGGPVTWNVKDPDGFTVQIIAKTGGFPGGVVPGSKIDDGQKNLKEIPAPSGKGFKAIGAVVTLNVSDIARSRDFYSRLLGMKVIYYNPEEPNSECFLRFGSNDALVLRKSQPIDNKPNIDHLAIVVANYNADAAETELKRRGLAPEPQTKFAWTIHDSDGYPILVAGQGVLKGKAGFGA
jgi:catechol 2,3-dioxygenase-like lactoylglutathione lyase family enzyme